MQQRREAGCALSGHFLSVFIACDSTLAALEDCHYDNSMAAAGVRIHFCRCKHSVLVTLLQQLEAVLCVFHLQHCPSCSFVPCC